MKKQVSPTIFEGKKQRAIDVLSQQYRSDDKIANLYDHDQVFASAIIDLFSPGFEYPDYSYLSVGQALAKARRCSQKAGFEIIESICTRLLDSEEHAVESAVPGIAEDAVELIQRLWRQLQSVQCGATERQPQSVEGKLQQRQDLNEVRYVIRSLSEGDIDLDGNAGAFWSQKDGWGSLESATRFSTMERMDSFLPISSGGDSEWMLIEEALELDTARKLSQDSEVHEVSQSNKLHTWDGFGTWAVTVAPALIAAARMAGYIDSLPKHLQASAKELSEKAAHELDTVVRGFHGFGVGDCFEDGFGKRYSVSGYCLPAGYETPRFRVNILNKDGSISKREGEVLLTEVRLKQLSMTDASLSEPSGPSM